MIPVTYDDPDYQRQLAIADDKLSKQHFNIVRSPEGFFLDDAGSKNGTWLNGKAVAKMTRLAYGDRIIAGGTVFRFFIEESLERD